jgi:hypothetical protein
MGTVNRMNRIQSAHPSTMHEVWCCRLATTVQDIAVSGGDMLSWLPWCIACTSREVQVVCWSAAAHGRERRDEMARRG